MNEINNLIARVDYTIIAIGSPWLQKRTTECLNLRIASLI